LLQQLEAYSLRILMILISIHGFIDLGKTVEMLLYSIEFSQFR